MTSSDEEKIVLIDTDAGQDDALAVFMAIQAHRHPNINFRIVGITTVSGNASLDDVGINVTEILNVADSADIPIYRGACHPMVLDYSGFQNSVRYHGGDGFGDRDPSKYPRPQPTLQHESATAAIIRLASEYSGKLSIVALGPLTNLALAVRSDNRIADQIKEIYIMGGSFQGRGNVSPCAEFNFHYDPESVHVTLTSYKCPITIAPVELATTIVNQSHEWRVGVLGIQNTSISELLNSIEDKNLNTFVKKGGRWQPHDSTIMSALIEPSVVKSTLSRPCWMEFQGHHTRGQLVIDHNSAKSSHIKVILDMDKPLFQRMLIWAVNSSQFYKNDEN